MTDLSIHRVLPHLPAAATWALALAIGVQAALIVRDLIPGPQSSAAPAVLESAAPPSSAHTGSVDLSGILNAHVFGQLSEGAPIEAVEAPRTQLSLVLAGTIAVEDPQKGLALVGESTAGAKVFAVGESVAGGVNLHAVYTDRVILSRSGKLEALYLPRQMAGSSAVRHAALAPAAPSPGAALAGRVRQLVSEDPGAIAEIMRPQPVFIDGKQKGFRVYPGRNREQFARLGLLPGDLVLSINGTPLDDPARGMEIFRSMGSASVVNVTIERAGRKQELNLDMTQLANQAAELGPPAQEAPPVSTESIPPNPEIE